jgi:hypothetical protein
MYQSQLIEVAGAGRDGCVRRDQHEAAGRAAGGGRATRRARSAMKVGGHWGCICRIALRKALRAIGTDSKDDGHGKPVNTNEIE